MEFFFFNDTATTEIYTLSLHDALPIYWQFTPPDPMIRDTEIVAFNGDLIHNRALFTRSTENTSELQSQSNIISPTVLPFTPTFTPSITRTNTPQGVTNTPTRTNTPSDG